MTVKDLAEKLLEECPSDTEVLSRDPEGYFQVPSPFTVDISEYGDMDICKLEKRDIPKKEFLLL